MARHDPAPPDALLSGKPPHHPHAEKAIVSLILQHPAAYVQLAAILLAEDFYSFIYRVLYETLAAMHAARKPIDEESVRHEIAARAAADSQSSNNLIGQIPALAKAQYNLADLLGYAQLVKDAAVRREMQRLGRELQYAAGDEARTTSAIAAAIMGEMNAKLASAESGLVSIEKVMRPVVAEVETRNLSTDHFRGIRTSFATLDGITAGYQPEQYYLFAAYSSAGKTALALNTILGALDAHDDLQVIYYSLEMAQFAIGTRLLSMVSGVDLGLIRAGYLTEEQWDDVARASSVVGSYRKRMLVNTRRVSIDNIASECRAMAATNTGLRRMIVVDYIQLVRAKAKERPDLTLRSIGQDFVDLSKELYCPVLVFAQLNGDEMERPPDFRPWRRDLRDAKALADDARAVFLMSRPWVHRKRHPEYRECFLRLIVDKHSEGDASEDVDLHFIGRKQIIREEECEKGCPMFLGDAVGNPLPPYPTKAFKKRTKKPVSDVQKALAMAGFDDEEKK